MIRNIDRIRQMSLEELAPLLVYAEEIDIGDFDYDENPISWFNSGSNILQKVLEDFAFQISNALDDDLIHIEECAWSGEYSDYEIAE